MFIFKGFMQVGFIIMCLQTTSCLYAKKGDFSLLFPKKVTSKMKYITVAEFGQLGNSCFRVASALSSAIDNGYYFIINKKMKKNYPAIFHRFPYYPRRVKEKRVDAHKLFTKMPVITDTSIFIYYPNSSQYFDHNSDVIRDVFKPSESTVMRLRSRHSYFLEEQEKYVGLHLRTFVNKNDALYFKQNKGCLVRWGISPLYYEQAINHFDEDTTFVVFTDNISAAREMLKIFPRKFIFLEGSSLEDDFYLISMMDKMIINNSSFGVFAAYLNGNRDKVVIMPKNCEMNLEIKDPKWVRYENDYEQVNISEEFMVWYDICKRKFLEL